MSSQPFDVNEAEFQSEVLDSATPVSGGFLGGVVRSLQDDRADRR